MPFFVRAELHQVVRSSGKLQAELVVFIQLFVSDSIRCVATNFRKVQSRAFAHVIIPEMVQREHPGVTGRGVADPLIAAFAPYGLQASVGAKVCSRSVGFVGAEREAAERTVETPASLLARGFEP